MHCNVWELAVKKTLKHPKADEALRIHFQAAIDAYQTAGHDIVYVDKSGFAKDAPRTHGYSLKNTRCYGICDWQAKGRINAIGAMVNFSFLTVSLIEGNVNSDVFYAWLTQDLLPKMKAGSVLVMDNATFHKRSDMLEAIKKAQVILTFLPPYSPDLNPIEKKWAQARAKYNSLAI